MRENFNCGKQTYKSNDFVLEGRLLAKLKEFLTNRNVPGGAWEGMANQE